MWELINVSARALFSAPLQYAQAHARARTDTHARAHTRTPHVCPVQHGFIRTVWESEKKKTVHHCRVELPDDYSSHASVFIIFNNSITLFWRSEHEYHMTSTECPQFSTPTSM